MAMLIDPRRYGPWALVAGASEGLGAAWGLALARRGLHVLLLARREPELTRTAEAIRAATSVQVATAVVDLASPDFLTTLTPHLDGREIGFYVHNAAFAPHGPFLDQPLDAALRSLEVNCRVPLVLTHRLGSAMAMRGRGAIVLMSSLTAFQGTPLLTTYGATKAFNLSLAEGLYTELAPRGVEVLACCAGATTTPGFWRSSPQGAPGQLAPEQVVEEALGRLGRSAFMIPGRFNRLASWMMRRLMPRATTVKLLADQARRLKAST